MPTYRQSKPPEEASAPVASRDPFEDEEKQSAKADRPETSTPRLKASNG